MTIQAFQLSSRKPSGRLHALQIARAGVGDQLSKAHVQLLGKPGRTWQNALLGKPVRARQYCQRGLNAPLIFYFIQLWWEQKKLSGARKVFFTRCTCFESNFCPPRFLNLINSPRLNCKDSPRTSSALALNCGDTWYNHIQSKNRSGHVLLSQLAMFDYLQGIPPAKMILSELHWLFITHWSK